MISQTIYLGRRFFKHFLTSNKLFHKLFFHEIALKYKKPIGSYPTGRYLMIGVDQSHESFVLIPHDLALLTCKGSPLEALQRQQAYLSSLGIDHGI